MKHRRTYSEHDQDDAPRRRVSAGATRCSQVGRAPALGAGGREFEPHHLDQLAPTSRSCASNSNTPVSVGGWPNLQSEEGPLNYAMIVIPSWQCMNCPPAPCSLGHRLYSFTKSLRVATPARTHPAESSRLGSKSSVCGGAPPPGGLKEP